MDWRLIKAYVWVDDVFIERYESRDVEKCFHGCHNMQTEIKISVLTLLPQPKVHISRLKVQI